MNRHRKPSPMTNGPGGFGFDAQLRSIAELAGSNAIPRRSAPRAAPPPELAADARLDGSIVPEARTPRDSDSVAGSALAVPAPRGVFLTGAAGFLGAHLLHELAARTDAEVHCLVRAADRDAARARILAALHRYRLWSPQVAARVIPIAGDLTMPQFGLPTAEYAALSRDVDAVIHNGARVNHAEPYARLRAANTLGTATVLRFACTAIPKPVHFVSTTSVGSATAAPMSPVLESARPALGELSGNGYVLSKWVGEVLTAQAAARGLPTVIHRPDRICGNPHTGAASPDDAFWTLVRAAILLGGVPPADLEVSLVPADYVASAIVHTLIHATAAPSDRPVDSAAAPVHHLVNQTSIRCGLVWERLRHKGFEIVTMPVSGLAARLETAAGDDPDLARALILGEQAGFSGTPVSWDDSNARIALAGSGIDCPPMSIDLIDRHIDYFVQTGFLPAPRH
ncbi:thioester reductase domain-containing protein [Nocardia sp. NPDC051832]|uniref:thioester reductase domain-containing protein n=1 Tax=Nocardia sp. NPDC051832 TaxID=3155673 RepID=UPI0034320322